MDSVRFVAIGIGINVNNEHKTIPEGATSLKEQKKENVNRIALLQDILRKIEANYLLFQRRTGKELIIDKWRNYNITLGKKVKVACQSIHLEGEAVDIDIDGGLLVRRDCGLVEKVMAGDVVHCR
jgi:BirA family biotin operon repressor/biotin-[acetyl-CoA-carboxylase] ligase